MGWRVCCGEGLARAGLRAWVGTGRIAGLHCPGGALLGGAGEGELGIVLRRWEAGTSWAGGMHRL